MDIRRNICLATCFGIVFAVKWYKSTNIGVNIPADIQYWGTVRSNVECAIECNKNASCLSYQFDKLLSTCTHLAVSSQTGPFVNSNESIHYSRTKTVTLDIPVGYSLLPTTNVAVKFYPNDYKTWNDSQSLCLSDNADLPVLDTDALYSLFRQYMDTVATARVAVKGFVINNLPYWATGTQVDGSKFCVNTPDLLNTPNVCLYMASSSESWCGSTLYRLDDALCSTQVLRICMKKL